MGEESTRKNRRAKGAESEKESCADSEVTRNKRKTRSADSEPSTSLEVEKTSVGKKRKTRSTDLEPIIAPDSEGEKNEKNRRTRSSEAEQNPLDKSEENGRIQKLDLNSIEKSHSVLGSVESSSSLNLNERKNTEQVAGKVEQAQNTKAPMIKTEEPDQNTQEETVIVKKSKKMLGPRSRRKRYTDSTEGRDDAEIEDNEHRVKAKEANLSVVNEIECSLSPESPEKNNINENVEDHLEDSEEYPATSPVRDVPDSTYEFILQKKHVKCNVRMASVFQTDVCKALCDHCKDTGAYTLHAVDLDFSKGVVHMECQSCTWTTVRRITLSTRIVPS